MVKFDLYKESGFPDIAEVPFEWTIGTVKSIFDVICGGTPSEQEENWGGEIPWVGPADMPMFGRITSGKRNITKTGYNSCGTTIVPAGSIVLSTRAPIGKICIANNELCTNQGCKCLVPKGNCNTQFYAYYLFAILERLQMAGTGTTFKELSTANLKKMPIPIISLSEQEKIGSFLDLRVREIDAIISEAKDSIEEYKQWKASIIYEAVTKGLDPDAEMVDSGVEWIGMMPNEWRVAKLKNFIDILPGYAFPSEGFLPEGIPLLRGINVTPNGIRWDDVVYWNEENTAYLKPFALEIGDVVMGLDRPWISSGTRIATIQEQDVPSYLLQRVCRIRVIDQADIRFVKYWLASDSFMKSLTTETTGISVPHISTNQIQNFVVAMPTLEIQKRICDYLDNTCARIDSLVTEKDLLIADLEAYKKSLIFEVVTGKRKVG